MLSRIEVQNHRSFLDIKVNLSPFTLVIGANGSGKSNFLRLFEEVLSFNNIQNIQKYKTSQTKKINSFSFLLNNRHLNYLEEHQKIYLRNNIDQVLEFKDGKYLNHGSSTIENIPEARLYNINPKVLELKEQIQVKTEISSNGEGIINTLESLKTGDREDLFDEIEKYLIRFIPSIEKLSSITVEPGYKLLQVREKGIDEAFRPEKLSEGTKFILIILTILHQENPPKLILLEDIDRGLHPRLFQKVVEMMRDIVKTKDVQIIATTHNPYLVDEFTGEEESVLIVEKNDTVSTITSLAERLDNGDTIEDALGSLWFSGFFGGVPTSS